MTAGADHRVCDLGQMILKLRPDLSFSLRLDGDEPGYVLEDKVNSKFYRVGVPEYTFISLLDGDTTVREALAVTARAEPEHALTEEEGAAVCQWLVENGLAGAPGGRLRSSTAGGRAGIAFLARWNPLFLRIPVCRPDRFLQRVAPWANWLFSPPTAAAALVLVCVALWLVLTRWHEFLASSRGVLTTDRWVWLATSWTVLKLIHELAHGVACKRYGGAVREAGVVLILGAPIAYVDITSCWRFRSKWQRIQTATAGMYVELLAAAMAALAWSCAQPGAFRDVCQQVFLMASITTILFNANPLMRFDGYYVASDFFEIPNLYSQGQQSLRRAARRIFLGLADASPHPTWTRAWAVAAYGAAALVWRITVYLGILIAASSMFHGVGMLLAALGLALWIGPPAFSLLDYLVRGEQWEQPRRLRFLLTAGGGLTALVLGAAAIPWPGAYRAPAMVQYAPLAIVRAPSPGFVREVHVQPGGQVRQDQLLAVLCNEQLELELADLKLAAQQVRNRLRALLHDGDTAEHQARRKELESLQNRLREKEQEYESLVIRAPIEGAVLGRNLASLHGRYLSRGDELLAIGSEDSKELKIAISQEDVNVFLGAVGRAVRVRICGTGRFFSPLKDVRPRASVKPPDPTLCAAFGGPLPVRLVKTDELSDSAERYELLTPRFEGSVSLCAEHSLSLLAGQRGVVSLRAADRSVAHHFVRVIRNYVTRIQAMRDAG